MNRKTLGSRIAVVVAVVLSLALVTQVVMAAVSADIGPYFRITLMDYAFHGDGSSTWTYEIEVIAEAPGDVSHISLGSVACLYVSPEGGETQEIGGFSFTIENPASEAGKSVVKWETQPGTSGMRSVGDKGTFELVILGAKENTVGENTLFVNFKGGAPWLLDGSGSQDYAGYVDGPICGTTAVNLTSLEGGTGTQMPILLTTLALGATVATTVVLSKAGKRE